MDRVPVRWSALVGFIVWRSMRAPGRKATAVPVRPSDGAMSARRASAGWAELRSRPRGPPASRAARPTRWPSPRAARAGAPAAAQAERLLRPTPTASRCWPRLPGRPAPQPCDVELRRGGVSYSIDTAHELLAGLPAGATLYAIVGADTLVDLPTWRQAGELLRLVTFCPVARADREPDPAPLAELAGAEGVERIRRHVLRLPQHPASSTAVRAALLERAAPRWLPPGVLDEIRRRGLYGYGAGGVGEGQLGHRPPEAVGRAAGPATSSSERARSRSSRARLVVDGREQVALELLHVVGRGQVVLRRSDLAVVDLLLQPWPRPSPARAGAAARPGAQPRTSHGGSSRSYAA